MAPPTGIAGELVSNMLNLTIADEPEITTDAGLGSYPTLDGSALIISK
jgi:hypothetical protein